MRTLLGLYCRYHVLVIVFFKDKFWGGNAVVHYFVCVGLVLIVSITDAMMLM